MYLQRRIEAGVHGEAYFDFSAIIGWKSFGEPVGPLKAHRDKH